MTTSSDELTNEATSQHAEEEAAAVNQDSPEGTPQQAPEVESGPDLSFLDDSVSSLLAAASERPLTPDELAKAAKELKRGHLRLDDYTRKTQDVAKQRKEMEALVEAGKNWQNLVSDEKMKEYVLAYGKESQKNPDVPTVEVPDDLDMMTGKELAAWILKNVSASTPAAAAPDVDAIQQELEQRLGIKEAKRRQELASAAADWSRVNDVEDDVANKACLVMREDLGVESLTPEMVTALLPRYVALVEAQVETERQQNTQRTVSKAEAASPRGGMGNASPRYPSPDAQVKAMEAEYGRPLHRHERASVFYNWLKDASGKSDSELDQEMFGDK